MYYTYIFYTVTFLVPLRRILIVLPDKVNGIHSYVLYVLRMLLLLSLSQLLMLALFRIERRGQNREVVMLKDDVIGFGFRVALAITV